MLYCAATRTISSGHEALLDVNEMRMLRYMCEVTRRDNIRNEHITGTTRVVQVSKKTKKKDSINWHSHVMRMDEE